MDLFNVTERVCKRKRQREIEAEGREREREREGYLFSVPYKQRQL